MQLGSAQVGSVQVCSAQCAVRKFRCTISHASGLRRLHSRAHITHRKQILSFATSTTRIFAKGRNPVTLRNLALCHLASPQTQRKSHIFLSKSKRRFQHMRQIKYNIGLGGSVFLRPPFCVGSNGSNRRTVLPIGVHFLFSDLTRTGHKQSKHYTSR